MTIEVEGIEKRWAAFLAVPNLVDQKFEDGRGYASDSLALANAVIEDLRQIGKTLNTIDTTTGINYITPPDAGTFTGSPPSDPNADFNMPGAPSDTYDLQSIIHDKIISDIINVNPAIPEAVETAIFERENERALLLHQDNLDRISAEWAKRGFTLSNAILGSLLTQAEIDYTNKRLDVSRDIAIKNFELSDTNVKFAIQQGLVYIGNRITIYKVEVDAEIARIDSIIKKYLGDIDAYKASAQVFTALADINVKEFEVELKQELVKANLLIKNVEIDIENFRVEMNVRLEAAKAIGSINAQVVAGALSSVSAGVSLSVSDAGQYTYSTNPSY